MTLKNVCMLKLSTLILIFIFIVFATNRPTSFIYIGFAILAFACLGNIFVSGKIKLVKVSLIDLTPLFFLAIWVYSLCLGLLRSNNVSYILQNNAGLALYISYYIFIQAKLTKERLFQILILAALCAASLTSIIFCLAYVFSIDSNSVLNTLLGDFSSGSSTGQNRVYFLAQLSIYVPLSYYLAKVTMSSKQLGNIGEKPHAAVSFTRNSILLFYCICTLVFFTASKGFMLGFCFLFVCVPSLIFISALKRGVISTKIFFYVGIIMLTAFAILSLGYDNILTSIFSKDDEANVLRYEQLFFIFNDLNIWGNGSGAVIPGYQRNDEKPYGFELSYINLIHKIGIFTLIPFISYIGLFLTIFRQIVNNVHTKYAIAALGAMTYLFVAIGNPLLFAPQSVLLHCSALYFLRDTNRK